jgi:hypothetical protein
MRNSTTFFFLKGHRAEGNGFDAFQFTLGNSVGKHHMFLAFPVCGKFSPHRILDKYRKGYNKQERIKE